MHVVTLGATLPLTKTFVLQDGVLHATPYPHISRVTSHHYEISDLPAFAELLRTEGRQGRCLFNGHLTVPLKNESRAGKTVKRDRDWVVFDFDKVEGTSAADVIMRYLPLYCHNVSYVSQLSASMFRPDIETWSGHIFMLLKSPISELRLKQWFEHLNFTQPALEASLNLSDSQQALHWPLDRTVAFNSKLIYIAPPKCVNFKAAVTQHIELAKKKKPVLEIPEFQAVDSITVRQKINALRRDIGLADISYNTQSIDGADILLESDVVEIHGLRTSGDHYIRFNLNGGDSYAYYIDLRNPELIRNFKGEPFLKTADAAPDLYKSLKKVAPRAVQKQALDDNTEVLAFYATNQSSAIKIGTVNTQRLVLNNASETAARAWMAEYGLVQKAFLPHLDLIFDPTTEAVYVPGMTQLNTYRPSRYMLQSRSSDVPSTTKDVPRTINRWLRSILGSPTEQVYAHFLNWLAYVFQTRQKTQTAWVLHGEEGTGKDTFVAYILKPLFGAEVVRSLQFGLLQQEFNDFLDRTLFVVFTEADLRAATNEDATMAKLRHYVTDSPIEIRKMRTDPYPSPNFSNLIFFSNQPTPIKVNSGQRRFNIVERQEEKLLPTPNEILIIQRGDELEAFADVLHRWPVNEVQVRQLIETQAAQDMHDASSTINQLVADAIKAGNLQFFLDRMPSDAVATADFFNRFNPLGMFKTKIDEFIEAAEKGEPVYLKDDELFPLFRTLIPDTRYFQDSKTWRLRHYLSLGLDYRKRHWSADRKDQKRGVRVVWQCPESTPLRAIETEKVTPITKGKKR